MMHRIGPAYAMRLSALAVAASQMACSSQSAGPGVGGNNHGPPVVGQTSFVSAPMLGQWQSFAGHGTATSADAGATAAPTAGGAAGAASGAAAARTVQETDLYAVEGTRLYYLNAYRGLMVFDISNPDLPTLLGRSAIFGDPQTMFVKNGVAVVVVGDWYGNDASGKPFHGSVVRGLDANDPLNIKPVGEVQVAGYVRDTRIVGDVLYAVSEDYGWEYGFYYGYGPYMGTGSTQASTSIVSVGFGDGSVKLADTRTFTGESIVFNVTPNAVLLAIASGQTYSGTGTTALTYVDISDPQGKITPRGSATVKGLLTWGPDNGRWDIDFADGQTAHAVTGTYDNGPYGGAGYSYTLSTVSFLNPDAPANWSSLPLALPQGYSSPAVLFDGPRLYVSSGAGYYNSGGDAGQPLDVYDLSNAAAPTKVAELELPGNVWLFKADGDRIFSIGNSNDGYYGRVNVGEIDITNPLSPVLMGNASFGDGWGWTPAASTFKALTLNDQVTGLVNQGLAVVPFSSWNYQNGSYTNGVELVQYTDAGIQGAATASTKGYVQRGIFVGKRLYSMSDLALAVIDYSNPSAPSVTHELTLARNVINTTPQGATIAELSSDWWGNDVSSTEMRVLPIANADETIENGTVPTATIPGVGAQTFQNGALSYVVTSVKADVPCSRWYGPTSGGTCQGWTQHISVVDTAAGKPVVRGQLDLPATPNGWNEGGWYGFYWDDWYMGGDVVQVGNDALAFSRWSPQFAADGNGGYEYIDDLDSLFVVDLSNADAPKLASTRIVDDTTSWWGNMLAIGNELYATHFEWVERPDPSGPYGTDYFVRYYLDQIDLTDRAHPKVGSKVNVPGIVVGGSKADPKRLFTVDYGWDWDSNPVNRLQAIEIDGNSARLLGSTPLDGWVGNVLFQNDVAYTTVQQYSWAIPGAGGAYTPPVTALHQIDLTDPAHPKDLVASDPVAGFGWLLSLDGDRALVSSGWGNQGVDIFKLSPHAAPSFEQFTRTRGWGVNSTSRQGDTIFLSTGYWGVQPVVLK